LRTHAGAAAYSTTGGSGEVIMFPLFHMAGWNFAMMAWSAAYAHLVRRLMPPRSLVPWIDVTVDPLLHPRVWRRILESDMAVDARSVDGLTGRRK